MKAHRSPRFGCHARTLALFLMVWLGFSCASQAQEPSASVSARLAPEALLLDATTVDGRIVAVGERGHVVISEDGGESWRQAQVPVRSTLTAVKFVDEQNGWAVGHEGAIVHSSDGGESWTLQHYEPDLDQPLLDLLFFNASSGIAIGAYGYYLFTRDGGQTWESDLVDEEWDYHLNAIVEASDDNLYIAGEAGSIYRSSDRGRTWLSLEFPYEGSLFGLLDLDGGRLMTFGLRGHVFESNDHGSTWHQVHTGTERTILGGRELDDGTVVLVGASGTLLTWSPGAHVFDLDRHEEGADIVAVMSDGEGGLLLFGESGILSSPGGSGE